MPPLVAAQRCLDWSLLALAFCAPVSIAGANAALVLATFALLALRCLGGSWQWGRAWGPVAWCLGLYCAVAVLSSLAGIAPAVSLRHLHKDIHKLWAYLVLVLAFRAVAARRLAAALALGLAFAASAGIAQSLIETCQNLAQHHAPYWMRARAFVHPVTYGNILALGLLGILAFLMRPPAGGPGARPLSFCLALATAALVMSNTRAALLGVVAGFAALCLVEPAFRRWVKWALLGSAVIAVLMELTLRDRSIVASLRHYGTAMGSNQQLNRLILWDVAWRMFQDHPWLGVGPSNFATAFPAYFQGSIDGLRVWTSAHNLFLHQLAERGLAGLAALAVLWGALFAGAWRRARALPGAWNLWALAATAAFFLMNLTETAFHNEQTATLFILIWARAEAGPDA